MAWRGELAVVAALAALALVSVAAAAAADAKKGDDENPEEVAKVWALRSGVLDGLRSLQLDC
jgi:hypothetical protein